MTRRDPTHCTSQADRFWCTVNIGEATPDVLSPLCWSFWGPAMEAGARRAYHDMGILPDAELRVPEDANELLTAHFFGRPAMNLDRLRSLFDAIPGMTADDFERDICGTVRPGLAPQAAAGRAVPVMLHAPAALIRAGSRIRHTGEDQRIWWESRVLPPVSRADALPLMKDSVERFEESFRSHVRVRFLLMALQAQLTKLAERAGRPELVIRLLGGAGDVAETAVADDVWSLGRGELDLRTFLRRHGYHGPNEGNVHATSWREDPGPVERLAAAMAGRPQSERPKAREEAQMKARRAALDELCAALPASRRATARWLCRAAGRAVQDNETGKAAYLRALDGGRAAARAIGAALVSDGVVGEIDDAFYLTVEELEAPPADARELISFRRDGREEYRLVDLPLTFAGQPEPLPPAGVAAKDGDAVLRGVAGSPGRVQGRARVLAGPDADFDAGEILVCRYTDPSWAPLFVLAAGLVIDIGAAASHGAIVARELGVPCVIGTADGTRRIRTGDLVEVDGSAGEVRILERAEELVDAD